jgi:very-short-patch-repair endonuclease
MRNLPEPERSVKGDLAPTIHEQAEPFVLRWLSDQRAALANRLAICESPVEVLFATALLSARGAAGPVFDLALHPPTRKPPLLAVSEAHGLRLYGQHEIATEGKRYRVDFTITGGPRKLAVEIDGHEFHASKAARSADAARDIALTKAGWTPARFTGSDIWRNADDCAARALDLLGVTVIGREALRPAAKKVERVAELEPEPPIETAKKGAAGVLAALLAEGDGTGTIAPIRRPYLTRPRIR